MGKAWQERGRVWQGEAYLCTDPWSMTIMCSMFSSRSCSWYWDTLWGEHTYIHS